MFIVYSSIKNPAINCENSMTTVVSAAITCCKISAIVAINYTKTVKKILDNLNQVADFDSAQLLVLRKNMLD